METFWNLGKQVPECLHSYQNVSVLDVIGAKDDGGDGDNWIMGWRPSMADWSVVYLAA